MLIRLHGLALVLVAFLLLVSPEYIPSSTIVWGLGDALQLPDLTKGSNSDGSLLSPIAAYGFLILALFHFFLGPAGILRPSKYNVMNYSAAMDSIRSWQGLAGILAGGCLIGAVGIYFIATSWLGSPGTGERGFITALGDRTLFAACFVEFCFWYYVYSALREELIELVEVGRERGEAWGIIGGSDDKVRL